MQDGLENGELGLEGGDMRGTEVGTVGGIGLGGLGAVCEGAEADAATGGHVDVKRYLVSAMEVG